MSQKIRIAVLPGDGIGPEVIDQGIKVLEAIGERYHAHFEYCFAEVGAVAIDNTGDPLPEATVEACLNADAVLFGAIGHPKYDNDPNAKVRPEQGLLRLRKALGLYANIRPVTAYPKLSHLSPLRPERVEGVDLIIMRELTSGIYFGEKGIRDEGKSAFDTCYYHEDEIERIARLAFEYALGRRKKLTLVDKANVLETSRLWRKKVQQMAGDYPQVELECMFVDNAAMQLIQYPKQFDVLLTSNMFGDILSDEASVLTGSMGLLPSASIGLHTSLFEPIHGSYPQATGKDIANPMATILSAAMMLDALEMPEAAQLVRNTVQYILEKGIGTPELNPSVTYGCAQIGDLAAHLIASEDQILLREDKISHGISTII
ncbi:MAG TPA: 3-isopropylmalate dehydrogenase [Saprospiraceae bacterium]|nr:3-isopropylmalate dehydrogenase [Saprospiraceae bacterium]HMQ83218.1 3-isopropylmalate dehydrogenase [Saprospiraceae bacterium]